MLEPNLNRMKFPQKTAEMTTSATFTTSPICKNTLGITILHKFAKMGFLNSKKWATNQGRHENRGKNDLTLWSSVYQIRIGKKWPLSRKSSSKQPNNDFWLWTNNILETLTIKIILRYLIFTSVSFRFTNFARLIRTVC